MVLHAQVAMMPGNRLRERERNCADPTTWGHHLRPVKITARPHCQRMRGSTLGIGKTESGRTDRGFCGIMHVAPRLRTHQYEACSVRARPPNDIDVQPGVNTSCSRRIKYMGNMLCSPNRGLDSSHLYTYLSHGLRQGPHEPEFMEQESQIYVCMV